MSRFDPELIQITQQNSMRIAADVLEPLSRFLTVARDECGGDADKVLLMVSIILRAGLHPDYRKLTREQVLKDGMTRLPSLGINVASLAESIGMPRETTRRKVRDLEQMGWVVQERGQYHFTAKGLIALTPARDALLRLVVRNYEIEAKLIEALVVDELPDEVGGCAETAQSGSRPSLPMSSSRHTS